MKKEPLEDGWHSFLKLCAKIDNLDLLDAFFELFLTIEERETLASRMLIIRDLVEKRKTQREIAEEHRVSISQITRGSNALKTIGPKLEKFLEKSLDR